MKTWLRSSPRARGFTLLEALVIVLVIAILASLAFPRFLEARNRSYVGAAQADLTLLRQALAFYAADQNRYPEALASLEEMAATVVDPQGRPYVWLPSGETFRWISYEANENGDYLLKIQALDKDGTVLCATAGGVTIQR